MRFRTKTILGIAFIELTLLSLLIIGTLHTLRQSNENELMRRVLLGGELLAASAKDAIIAHDFATLDSIVEDMLKTEQFIYVRFLDDSGFTLAKGGHAEDLAKVFVADEQLQKVDDAVFDKQVWVNLNGINYGQVQFGISVKPLTILLTQTWQWTIAIALLNMFLVALFSWILGNYLSQQLMRLRDASHRFAEGDLDYRIEITTQDELAETAQTFNNMVEQLAQSHQKLSAEVLARKKTAEHLQRANADLAHFTKIAAHHLQEPPRRLISFTQYLKNQLGSEMLNDDIRMSLMFIEESATRQRALIQDIQRYLAAEQPRAQIECVKLKPVLEKVLQYYEETIKNLNATIIINELPDMMIDKPRLNDLCHKLIDNALHYHHPDRKPVIQINGESKAGKNYYYFTDNGMGIPKQYNERVFQVFERLQVDHDKNRTGVGLAIVKRIVESCEGHIFLQDSDSGGITVVLEFPEPEVKC